MKFINRILLLIKRKQYIYGIIIILLLIGGIFIFNNKKTINNTIVINHKDFINQVSVSGKVVSSQEVDLSFKNSGRIERIYFPVVGKTVKAGTLIAELDVQDAKKTVRDAELSLQSAQISLDKLKIQNSSENLNADLTKAYDDGFSYVSDAFLDLPSTVSGLESLLAQNNLSENSARMSGKIAQDYRSVAENEYYKAKNAFDINRIYYRTLNYNSLKEDIDKIINQTYETTKLVSDAIKKLRNFVDYLSEDTGRTSEFISYQDTLSSYTSTINRHLNNLLAIKTSIKNYKDAFPDNSLDIESSILLIKQKENSLQDAKDKLENYYIRAPFDGIITRMDARVGEISSSNTSLVSLMSVDTFQIESFVPEVNIAQIKLGDEAKVTLDAYGEDVLFYAKVISIDPAETVRDGVSTYKTKLQFSSKDDRIRSGMTANVSITTFNKPNVIVVPGGVVFDKDGKNFVQVKVNKKIIDTEVVLGSVSALGQVEIISGLKDGDEVILSPLNSIVK